MKSARNMMGPPNPETKPSFAACIDACAARAGCKSVDYNADTSACTYLGGAYVCRRFSERLKSQSSHVRFVELVSAHMLKSIILFDN